MNKKGISMIMFVIAIAMVLVLVTAFTTSYNVIIESTRIREFANELNLVQRALEEYKFMNGKIPVADTTSVMLDPYRQEKSGVYYKYDVLDLERLGIKELGRGMPGNIDSLEVYAVSQDTEKVFYLAGVEIGKKWYYTLTDELKEKLDI